MERNTVIRRLSYFNIHIMLLFSYINRRVLSGVTVIIVISVSFSFCPKMNPI
jgi:hypothetical protein